MLLPQSSAFISLRNRLNAVSSLGFLHIAPRRLVTFMGLHFLQFTNPTYQYWGFDPNQQGKDIERRD